MLTQTDQPETGVNKCLANQRLDWKGSDQSETALERPRPIRGWIGNAATNHRLYWEGADQSETELGTRPRAAANYRANQSVVAQT